MNNENALDIYSGMSNLVEAWSNRISVVEQVQGSPLPYEKKVVLAQCLQNTKEQIALAEATDVRDVEGFKHFAIDLVTAVVPNLVANEIVSIQPISNKVGVINYIKYIYGSTKGNVQAGQEFASAIRFRGSDPYYSSQEIPAEGVSVTPGKGANGKIESVLAWRPIVKGSVKLEITFKNGESTYNGFITDKASDGVLVLTDADGKIVNNVIGESTIDYTTGQLNIVMAGDNELTTDSTSFVSYMYDNMSIGDGAIGTNQLQVPEINIKIETMPVVCQSRKLKALYAFDAAYQLQKEYGQDINALLNSQIASEIAHEIDGELMSDLYVGAGLTNKAWNETRPEGVSTRDHYDSFRVTINAGSNKIFGATKRAKANFIICGMNVATVIESMSSFVPSNIRLVVGPHISGTVNNMMVIVNPYFPDDGYVLGYRGQTIFDAGYYYCPYMPITVTQLIMADDFVGRRGWATMYAKKLVQPLLYCRGEILHVPYSNSGVVVDNG